MKNEIIEAMMMGANEINRLRNENQKLKQRIDKAIEYIESCAWSNGIDDELQYSLHIPTLLKILKGEDKE